MFHFLCVILSFRFGEAAHPGPATHDFTVGAVNPTGLLGKVSQLEQLPHGIFGVSESHLTPLGIQQFRRELAMHKSTRRYLTCDPAPYRKEAPGAIGGKHTGVGVLTSFPGRNLPVDWPESLRDEARMHVAAINVHQHWLKVGTCYGYAHRPFNLETRAKTDHLLSLVVSRIVLESVGPRIVMGDWNQTYGVLPQQFVLEQHGFVEVQKLAESLWNISPRPTCKGCTVKDFIWISPELIPMIKSVFLDDTLFSDHSVLCAEFASLGIPQVPSIWRKPLPLPWEEVQINSLDSPLPHDISSDNAQSRVVSIMNHMENCVHHNLVQNQKHGLLPCQRGRCCTLSPIHGRQNVAPPKNARHGEVNPKFGGENATHLAWLRQLRRLQSLVRLLSTDRHSGSKTEHAHQLWQSIRKASGFKPSFSRFWFQRSVRLPDSPVVLPHALPSGVEVSAIFATFKLEFDQFESTLRHTKHQQAMESRKSNPHKVFHDVSKPRSFPVQTLMRSEVFALEEIDEHGKCKVVNEGLHEAQSLFGPRGFLQAQILDSSHFQIVGPHDLCPGDNVIQKTLVGNPNQVLAEFENMWMSFWGRHQETPVDRWIPFVNRLKQDIPEGEAIHLPEITTTDWIRSVKAKKCHSAVGPDGISKMDLVNMPSSCTTALVTMLNCVENGGEWPKSLLIGLIGALEKKEGAEKVSEYRPICILSFVYRVWSSLRAKQLLRALAKIAPPELIGSRPAKETADLWWQLSLAIEQSFDSESHLSGVQVDISKCFNALPRVPVFVIARWLGFPASFCEAWHRALGGLERRFCVNGHVGAPLSSTCGFPEGDPLSVVAMYLINIVVHKMGYVQHPEAQIWTYVDDWQLIAQRVDAMLQAFSFVADFANWLDLDLDPAKSFFWSTCPQIRKFLREQGRDVKLHCRNLGGHLSYCKLPTNATVTQRIRSLEFFWHWLQRSPASLPQKINAVVVVAWPRSLHGAGTVILGDEHIKKLRRLTMQSLALNKKGANPILTLSCILPVKTDPGFHLLMLTFRAFRKFVVPDIAFPLIESLLEFDRRLHTPGPCSIFLCRLHEIGWAWDHDGWLLDHECIRIHLLDTPIQVLYQRLRDAWFFKVGHIISSRKGFHGLSSVMPEFTMQAIHKLDIESQGLMRVALNGSFYTRDLIFKTGKVSSPNCPFCGETDSIFHRCYECNHFQGCRDKLPQKFFHQIAEMEECTVEHGWIQEPPESVLHRHFLSCLPDTTCDFVGHFEDVMDQPHWHIFTDGSCDFPTRPHVRLAGWGMCVANLHEDSFIPISQGIVPGLHQSSVRGEMCAAISGCSFALRHNKNFWLWVDNQQVVDWVVDVIQGRAISHTLDKDHDLKSRLARLVLEAVRKKLDFRILKIRSHMDPQQFSDTVELWAIRGNDFADQMASQALMGGGQIFQHNRGLLVARFDELLEFRDQLHNLFLTIGQMAVANKEATWEGSDEEPAHHLEVRRQTLERRMVHSEAENFSISDGPLTFDFSAFPKLGDLANVVYQWLRQLVSAEAGEPQWMCVYQLLTLFQLETGRVGVKRNKRDRSYREISRWEASQGYEFLEVAADFSIFLRFIVRKAGGTFKAVKCLPSGTSFRLWCQCIRITAPSHAVSCVDQIFASNRVAPVRDVKRSFADFIPACRPQDA